jgi:hypothetical protein
MSALAYGREDLYSAPGWYYWFAFQEHPDGITDGATQMTTLVQRLCAKAFLALFRLIELSASWMMVLGVLVAAGTLAAHFTANKHEPRSELIAYRSAMTR